MERADEDKRPHKRYRCGDDMGHRVVEVKAKTTRNLAEVLQERHADSHAHHKQKMGRTESYPHYRRNNHDEE